MSTRKDPSPKAIAAALLMMARTASYVPKELSLPSFSLGLTDSSQEETQTQEGVEQAEAQVVKSPETTILIEELDVLVEKIVKSGENKIPNFLEEKFNVARNESMREKCYLSTTRIRTYGDDCTDEYDSLCTLNAQEPLVLSRVHFASLKAKSYIEADPKSKKPFKVKDYPMFLPYLNWKKLASHPYVNFCACLLLKSLVDVGADVRKKKFYILDPYHKTCPSKDRMKGYVISRIRVYARGHLSKGKIMKLSLLTLTFQAKTQKVDHFRVEFASRIIFHDMNHDRDAAIKGSETMRLLRPSAALLSPYCQVDSYDIESDSD
ncbi:hypothetical protein Ahy_Scaffold1g107179 [Arachis hypogaea]|uniref:Uncharacterized protein n=1 Tax=Arachis hypogaea TaxID=3818 RepID=A0A444WUV5_ARAHY|nr:hypothetical protein Ahy_Scaffold1g107179 [Arachis hypogaea]